MGSCCSSAKEKSELPLNSDAEKQEETEYERQILLQELDKISELISPYFHKSLNAYLESIDILLDSIRERISKKRVSIILNSARNMRLLMQKFREAFHEIRVQDSIDINPEQKDRSQTLITQLEGSLKSQLGGPIVRGFYDTEEKCAGFDQIFDKMTKMHKDNKEKAGKNSLTKFSSNISANFWISSFQGNNSTKWKEFSEAFQKFASKVYDINIEAHELIIIQSEVDYNNDLMIDVDCWDYFYREIWVNHSKRNALLATADDLKESFTNLLKFQLDLRYFRTPGLLNEGKETFFPNDSYFYLSEDRIKYSPGLNLPPKEKDLLTSFVLGGKHPKAEISFDKSLKEVSTKQFQIHIKKTFVQKNQTEPRGGDSGLLTVKQPSTKIETWFILNNMGKRNMVSFLVDERGFALTKGMIVNVNGNSFKVNEVNPSPNLYAEEDIFYLDTRPKGPNRATYRNPQPECFIDLEFFKSGPKDIKKYTFTAPKKDDFFQITIGSMKRKSKRSDIFIEDEPQNYVSREHCFILYNPKKGCWIIKDETYKKEVVPFFKTFVFSCGYDEYEAIHKLDKDTDYVARGQRLTEGMRFMFVNNIFEVKSIKELKEGEELKK